LVRLTPAGKRVCGELLAEQRAALAELLAELPETTSATCYRYWSHCAPCWPEPPTVPGWPRQNLEKGQSVDGLRIDGPSDDELVDRGAEPLGLAGSLRPSQLAGEAAAYELLSRALVLPWSARW
jgi:hypothetical protein